MRIAEYNDDDILFGSLAVLGQCGYISIIMNIGKVVDFKLDEVYCDCWEVESCCACPLDRGGVVLTFTPEEYLIIVGLFG